MGNVLRCENCKYYKPYGDPFNPRSDGRCDKLRLTSDGFLAINTEYNDFCSHFVKKNGTVDVRKEVKEEFTEIPRFNAENEPALTTQILMSISGWAYEKGLDVNEVMNHVGFVIQRASKDNPINWKDCGRKLVEGDEKDHD